MYINWLVLKNFKRFTDLTINIPKHGKPPRLVLLLGANGSGKSSVFDAFEYLSSRIRGAAFPKWSYYDKDNDFDIRIGISDGNPRPPLRIYKRKLDGAKGLPKSTFYGRSAHRANPVLTSVRNFDTNLKADNDRPKRYIDKDVRFPGDVQVFLRRIMAEVFSGTNMDLETLRQKFIKPLNDSFERIFGNGNGTVLRLESILPDTNADKPPQIKFTKGNSTVDYHLLSSGEKEVFGTLLNLFVRRDDFLNTIYYIDELDAHLHTSLQFNLIREIVEEWLPPNCQLWTASHSLGFIEYAQASEDAVIIDFDELDFDKTQVLEPAGQKSAIFEVAVPSDSSLRVFPNRAIVLCENRDIDHYSRVEQDKFVFAKSHDKGTVIHHSTTSDEFLGLIDGDFLTAAEKQKAMSKHPALRILPFYSIESLLYHPANLAELSPEEFSQAAYEAEILKEKKEIETNVTVRLRDSRRNYYLIKEWSKDEKSAAADEIAQAIRSDEFDTFYPFLDMKSHRPKQYLAPFHLNPVDLAQTDFFRDQLLQALNTARPPKG